MAAEGRALRPWATRRHRTWQAPPLSWWHHQPRGLALLSLHPALPRRGRAPVRTRHHGVPRSHPPMVSHVWAGRRSSAATAASAAWCFCLCSGRPEHGRHGLDALQQRVHGDLHGPPCPPSLADVAHGAPAARRICSWRPCIRPPIARLLPTCRSCAPGVLARRVPL